MGDAADDAEDAEEDAREQVRLHQLGQCCQDEGCPICLRKILRRISDAEFKPKETRDGR